MVWRVGQVPCAVSPLQPSGGASTPYLSALGDTAVDFDIAPPRAVPTPTAADTADTTAPAGGKELNSNSTMNVRIANANPNLAPSRWPPMR